VNPKSWIVRMHAVVEKEVVCEDCTEKQARDNPFEHAIEEREISQYEYAVKSVVPNE
jgi:hypothetical protein